MDTYLYRTSTMFVSFRHDMFVSIGHRMFVSIRHEMFVSIGHRMFVSIRHEMFVSIRHEMFVSPSQGMRMLVLSSKRKFENKSRKKASADNAEVKQLHKNTDALKEELALIRGS